ncbi:MAG: hypothetical protein ACRC1O_05045 [Ralstonia mannitolilytica]
MPQNEWNGLSADERDSFVNSLVEYGTGFVAPLYSVVEKIEETLQQKNSAVRAQADARPVAEQWKTWVHEWMGEHDVILPTQAYTELLGTHPEASAPRLSEADRNVIESAIREVELSCQYALAEDLRAILTRASAATVAEPSKIEPMRYDALEKAASEARAHIESECEKIGVGKAAQQQAEPESVIKRQAQKIGELIADRDSWIEAHARLYRLYHDQSPRAGEEIHVNVEGGDVYTLPLQLSGMDKPRFVVHVPCSPQAEPGADDRVARLTWKGAQKTMGLSHDSRPHAAAGGEMTAIANRRRLLDAAHALTKTNRPTELHYSNLLDALSAVASDDMGYPVKAYIWRDNVAEARRRFGVDATQQQEGGDV